MRKLKLQMQTSVDGYNSTGPGDQQEWVTWDLHGILPHVLALLDSTDTILLGRKLAEDYIPYWLRAVENPSHPMYDLAQRITRARKIVFTRTLKESLWPNSELATGDLAESIGRLKEHDGKDLVVYGGSSFVESLISAGLVDEFHLFVNPVALGNGKAAFSQLKAWQQLTLKDSRSFPSGIVLLHYEKQS